MDSSPVKMEKTFSFITHQSTLKDLKLLTRVRQLLTNIIESDRGKQASNVTVAEDNAE